MAPLWVIWYSLAVAFSDPVHSADGPKITECRSLEVETFTCRWSVGNYQNLTEHSQLKFFYTKGKYPNWRECPTYINRESTCYFNQTYTMETEYCVQLKSGNITHEQRCFTLDDIVKPDAPISLNWALLNISQSGLFMDIQLWWEDMANSDISSGWNPRKYEIQYKPREAELWESIETLPNQHPPQPLYNFATGKEYVVRLRCTYPNIGNFSEFSNILKVFLPTSQSVEVPLERPRITECRSPEQETFTCRWSVGNYQNLTERRRLRFFYTKGNDADWKECPKYMHNENSCYFNQTYTSIWISYCVQLKSDFQDQNITFDKRCFSIDNIVKPDPPIALNWTLLNISQSGLLADIQVFWEAPPTADIRNGWISLKYEIQYKASENSHWDSIEAFSTSHPVYALSTGKSYEIRLRCKQIANGDFSEFSDLMYIFIPAPRSVEEAGLLFRLILVFVLLGMSLMLLLILFTKSQRLKLFFLPPVPVPKINGIDPDLLKKGKIDEVNSIFANHLSYKSDLYVDDPWVEFIDVDLDDPDGKAEVSDTDRLLGQDHLKSDNCLSVKDDDSGRDSCYEPDVSEEVTVCKQSPSELSSLQLEANERKDDFKGDIGVPLGISGADTKWSQQPNSEECKCSKVQMVTTDNGLSTVTKNGLNQPPLHSQLSNQSSFGRMDFYAQVSDITPTGGVLLSPGQQNKLQVSLAKETSLDPKANQKTKPSDSAYTSEVDAKQFCAINSSKESLPDTGENLNTSSYFTTESLANATVASCKQTENTRQPTVPVPDYTSIHMVDSQQSLLLNPNVLPSKNQPALAGYLMPEQLGNVIP
ncbi:growth hormone receptor-like [Carcharodon carcharias]|uniref:growth hormone receptor-like n=1 Tax=Carcharodon carcharias TaxID=13397 RepID=UPI001B7EC970|nr:growth hormone receptor-like [Carcharodon carcharias]